MQSFNPFSPNSKWHDLNNNINIYLGIKWQEIIGLLT